MICAKCCGQMRPGLAIVQTYRREPYIMPDLWTYSPGGPGKLIQCLKCADCGWSVRYG